MSASRIRSHLLAAVAAVGLIGTGAAIRSGTTPAQAGPALSANDTTISDTAERVVESVVNISVRHEEKQAAPTSMDPFSNDPFFQSPFSPGFGMDPGPRISAAKGSGVIVTANGRILTNAHVVDGFEDIKVTLNDGTELPAKVVGKDTKADLAVIQLTGNIPPLKPIVWGDSSNIRLGELVLAVGDGLGVGKSVSMGIVSAKGRGNVGIEQYEDFIQTDAAINPGNSGGALVNMKGELIGINTAIASRSGGYSGIGFAIPTNMARPIMEALVKDGKVTRGFLGVNIATLTPSIAQELQQKNHKVGATSGVYVAGVEKSGPAGKAGLRKDDVITALDGKPIKDGSLLRNTIAMMRPGTNVNLEVVHSNGAKGTVNVRLGQLPDKLAQGDMDDDSDDSADDSGWQKMPNGWECRNVQNGRECRQLRH